MYYLQSRYYDPETCRFINADNGRVLGIGMNAIGGTNLFSYCLNNPVMGTDPSGEILTILLLLATGAIAGGVVGGIYAYDKAKEEGNNGNALFWSTMAGIGVGASIGVAVTGIAIAASAAIFAGVSTLAGGAGINAMFLGVAAKQAFAIGALSYNLFAFVVAPLIGKSAEGIEYEGGSNPMPKPQPNNHPGNYSSALTYYNFE